MRLGIVINPTSGRRGRGGAPQERIAIAERFVDRRRGVQMEAVLTTARGHAAELAAGFVARQFDVVVAWGGDGTANEVAGPLIGSSTALGVVAQGSGEGLARGLGLPSDADAALAAAIARPGVSIDVGYLAGRHFLNVAGIGFDAEVALDGRRADGAYFMIAFANGREFGNRMVLAADADFRDGWLDAVLVDAGRAWRQVWRARRLALATRRPAQGIHRERIKSATIAAAHLVCHVDGEPFDVGDTADVRIVPAALRVAGL